MRLETQFSETGGAVYWNRWRSLVGLVAQSSGTGGAVYWDWCHSLVGPVAKSTGPGAQSSRTGGAM